MRQNTLTLGAALDRALETHWTDGRNYYANRSNVAVIKETLSADCPLATIDDKVIAKMVLDLRQRGLSGTTINRKLSTLQTVLRLAKEDWAQPVKDIRFGKYRAKEKNGRVRVFSEQEEDCLVSLASELDSDVADLLVVLFGTGMRLSEGLRLEARDVNLETNMLSIWTTKNDVPRSIPMTSRVRAVISKRLAAGRLFNLNDNRVKYIFRLVRDRAGLAADKECVIHAVRHTVASRLVQRGVPLYTVQKFMGHSTIKVTERYAHLSPEQLADAASLLERRESIPPTYKPEN